MGYSFVPRTVVCEGMSALCIDAFFTGKKFHLQIKIRIHNMSAYWKCKILKQHQVEV